MRILEFMFRGELYQVDEQGRINANNLEHFSNDWVFLGGSSHHWHNGITVHCADAFENPSLLNGCLGWDIDHGTTRRWGGQYNGKLPRISNATVVERAEDVYPGMYDVTQQETDDILHDYKMMLETFGEADETVVKYKNELLNRGVQV